LEDRPAPIVDLRDGDARLELRQALEFWPLVGDVASQERRGARVVDSSSERVEIVVTGEGRVTANGRDVALRPLAGDRRIAAVRRRTFTPSPGFHPDLAPQDPLVIEWRRARVELHSWIPGGGVYPGLPADAQEAARRRAERIVIKPSTGVTPLPAPDNSAYTLDLRR
jgi:uncharacterized protein (DUF2126 family)